MFFDGLRDALRERATKGLRIEQIPKRGVVLFEYGNKLPGFMARWFLCDHRTNCAAVSINKRHRNVNGTM